MKQNHFLSASVILLANFLSGNALAAPIPAASYLFNNTLAAQEAGVVSLAPVNPLGTNGFVSDTVFGQTRQVYQFNGNPSPEAQQAGLSLDTTGLVANANYSVEMVFQFTQNNSGWRRIIDVENRQSDNGFYVDTSNQLAVFPVAGGANFTQNTYHDVVLVDSANNVSAYIDGTLAFSTPTNVMNINNAGNLMNFFLDNISGGGLGEYSSGSVALIRLYSGALTAGDVANLANNPFAPIAEPTAIPLMGIGFAALLLGTRRKPA